MLLPSIPAAEFLDRVASWNTQGKNVHHKLLDSASSSVQNKMLVILPRINNKVIAVSSGVAVLVGKVFLEITPLGRGLLPVRICHGVGDYRDARLLACCAGGASKFEGAHLSRKPRQRLGTDQIGLWLDLPYAGYKI